MQEPNLTQDPLSTITRQINELLELNKTSDMARLKEFSHAVKTFENSCLYFMKHIQASISSMVAERVNVGLEEVKALIRDQCSNKLSAVQSQVNEIVEHSRHRDTPLFTGARLEEVVRALHDSECKLKEDISRFEANLSSRLTETVQCPERSSDSQQMSAGLGEVYALIRDASINNLLVVKSQVKELVDNSRQHDASRLEALVRALSDSECRLKEDMNRVEANLCSKLKETMESLKILTDSQTSNVDLEELKTFITNMCSEPLSTVQSRTDQLVELLASQRQEMANACQFFADELKNSQKLIECQQPSVGLEEIEALVRDKCSDPLLKIESRVEKLHAQSRQLPETVSELKGLHTQTGQECEQSET
ncbi:hypothetical protein MTO96_024909 [Rhipicephalus appendiculatus]